MKKRKLHVLKESKEDESLDEFAMSFGKNKSLKEYLSCLQKLVSIMKIISWKSL
jgi:hypothetical protein